MHNLSINIIVLGFTETRLVSHLSSLYKLPGYYIYTNSRNIHGGGGVIYVSNNYVSSVQNEIIISDSYIETIRIEAAVIARKYLFLCIY